MRPLHISLNTAHSACKPSSSISSFTHSYRLSPSTRTSHPCHHHISTGRHPIISTLTLHMPKPPQSTTPHHFCQALNTQKTVQVLTSLPILQRHPTHPSHHHALCSLQAMQIISLHCLCLSPIYQHVLCSAAHYMPVHCSADH